MYEPVETNTAKFKLTILKGDGEYPVVFKPGKNLLEILRQEGLYTEAPCGGEGRCGKCLVQVKQGVLPPTDADKRKFSKEKLQQGFRLACKAVPETDLTLAIPKTREEEYCVIASREKEAEVPEAADEWGIAIDMGTTTLVMHKVDLKTCKILDTWTSVNHQNRYGADVISRIERSLKGDRENLRACIRMDLSAGIYKFLRKAPYPEFLKEICIAGNTTMFHLLLGYDCRGLSRTPFTPVNLGEELHSLSQLIHKDLPEIPVKLLPGLAPFVGADITAGIYGCDMDIRDEICMLIDVGTNGEMVLGNKNGLLCTSTAAGPAFEGGNISCGMGSLPGAIRSVEIVENQVRVQTIQDEPPRGICGTGVLDAVAELYKAKLMDETGRLEEFLEGSFVLCPKTGVGDIVLTQKDIREIQLAKAAIRAGIETLLKEAGISPAHLEKVFLAGGFGFSMDLEKAFCIGLFPEGFKGKIEIAGNSSVDGCIKYLKEREDRKRVSAVRSLVREVDLSVNKDFQEYFIEYMEF